MPLSDGASGVIANEFLQNTDPLGTSYELQETKNNPKPYFPQQGSDPLERITALGVSQQSSVPLQNTDAQLPNNEPAFSIPDSKFVVNRGDVLLNFFEDLTFWEGGGEERRKVTIHTCFPGRSSSIEIIHIHLFM